MLVFSAFLLARNHKSANDQDLVSSSNLPQWIRISCVFSAFVYAGLVYWHVLPLPESDYSQYRLSIGGAVAILGLIYLILGFYYLRNSSLYGLAALMFFATAISCLGIFFTESSFELTRNDWALYLHLFLSLCSYALLSVAALLTVIAPWLSRQLRKNPAAVSSFFPSLERLDSETFKLIGLGFLLLSIALLSGFFFLENILGQHLPHKVILSLLSWLVFGVLLLGRWRLGWRGKTAMRFALIGFMLLLLAYFGSKWVLEVLLQRSWS